MISFYKDTHDKKNKDTGIDDFINGVRSGKWQDIVLKIRTIPDKKERTEAKKGCPLVTVSGSFTDRKDASLRKHSGFIAIDLDNIDNPNVIKELLATDKYIYASFISISGTGLCLLFKIDGSRHLESFEGIAAYLYETYQLIIDQSGKNVGRARFVSYDPYLVFNPAALLFKKYPPKKRTAKPNPVVIVQSDFDEIIRQMQSRQINICEDYNEWLSTAYALVSEFAEAGRSYFHALSGISGKYVSDDCDKQFDLCLKAHKEGKSKTATIGSIYYHAKQSGIEIYSSRTKEIIRATQSQVKAGMDAAGVGMYLQKFQEIPFTESAPIIEQVITKQVKFASENIIEDIQSYLAQYSLRRNAITRNIEMKGKPIDDADINSIFIDIKSVCDKATKDLVCSVLFSNRIETYNPIFEFYEANKNICTGNEMVELCSTIITDTADYDTFILKWYVALIASIHGEHSPLALVLTGGINTGKTQWFRRLLPRAISTLYTEEKLAGDNKDSLILMTKKLIIMDDEWGGMSKKEAKFFKALMSKQMYPVREPYGRVSLDLNRLAVFCGTSNEVEIIQDPEENRRLLPINVISIDHAAYNKIDKDALFVCAWKYYLNGYDYHMGKSDIETLSASSERHKMVDAEEELINAYFATGGGLVHKLTNTEIMVYLKSQTQINCSSKRIGMALKNMGFIQEVIRINSNKTSRVWHITYKKTNNV